MRYAADTIVGVDPLRMPPSTPINLPAESLRSTPSAPPPRPFSEADETIRRLRAESGAVVDPARQARLLSEMAELEERVGDDAAAARDYLAAYEADPNFREPLEGVGRLLERRTSLRGLARFFFDALVEAAVTCDERVRALLVRAEHLVNVSADLASAQSSVREATAITDASAAEQAIAWLTLEVLAGRSGDTALRDQALAERARFAGDATWRALLLVDRARSASASDDVGGALRVLAEARAVESEASWLAAVAVEQTLRDHPAAVGTPSAREWLEQRVAALEGVAGLVQAALVDPVRGDALGVPHWVRDPGRAVDAWLRAAEERRAFGHIDGAAADLNRALFLVDRMERADARLAEAAVSNARIRLSEQMGDTALAAQLAARRLATEIDGPLSAALALRVAEHCAAEGDRSGALDALARAVANDPGSIPARALQLDILADAGDAPAFASQLEAFADHVGTDEARCRTFLVASYVWAARAGDAAGAKAALTQAGMFGASPETTARVGRLLSGLTGDASWYEEATKRLIASGAAGMETPSLYAELTRLRWARGDLDLADKALNDLARAPGGGAWLAYAVQAFAGSPPGEPARESHETAARARLSAVQQLGAIEGDPERARGLTLIAAMRAQRLGDLPTARQQLASIAQRHPDDPLVIGYLGDLHRAAGDRTAAAALAAAGSAAIADGELAAALALEAAIEEWRLGRRAHAVDLIEAAMGAPEAARTLLGWASWAVDPNSLDRRRDALRHAEQIDGDRRGLIIERFATELAAGDALAAETQLTSLDAAPAGALSLAGALGRLIWQGPASPDAVSGALSRVAARSAQAATIAAAERLRIARDTEDPDAQARAGQGWFEAGGGLPAALEWLAAGVLTGDPRSEAQALSAVADGFAGPAREGLLAGAALLLARSELEPKPPLIHGTSPAARIANLDLAPPGSDPRRRAAALSELGDALGDDAAVDAAAMGGWAQLAALNLDGARAMFESVVAARPTDLSAWEGLRGCAERNGDRSLRARASAELGALCADPRRGAAFWEEAALLWLSLGDADNADRALDASFARDATRPTAFDRLFRRTRDRRDNEKLLSIIGRRLGVTDEPNEIQKLFWEQARVLREIGDHDGALKALEHVTLLDPDHVGALALLGEVNIRRGQFEEAAASLGRLASLEGAPAKNRVTAGVAAVDLYENKLRRFDKALDVLLTLHAAKLSTLPVRERLAKAAARNADWTVATSALEELMNERPERAGRIEAARLAMVIHRDRLGAQGALAAVVKLLSELPSDDEALELLLRIDVPSELQRELLVQARRSLVELLRQHPMDPSRARRLFDVAQALGDDRLAQATLGALAALGASDPGTQQAFAQIASRKPRTPQVAATDAVLRAILAPGDEGPLADLFALLGPTLAEALGPNLATCGVGRRDRIDPRSGLALRNEIASWAGALRLNELELYVGGKDPAGVQGVAGEPPALIVGVGINSPLAPLTRGRVARELLALARGTTIVRWRDDLAIAAIVIAACRFADVRIEHPPYAILAEIERLLGRALTRKTRRLLPEVCSAIVAHRGEARAWSQRALASHDRMAVVASGDPSVVLGDILAMPVDQLGQAVAGNPRAEELLRFVFSPAYIDVRSALGLEGDGP